jgi:hypothetical protein
MASVITPLITPSGIIADAPFTKGSIPVINVSAPPALTNSIITQVADTAAPLGLTIVIGTDPAPGATTNVLRVQGSALFQPTAGSQDVAIGLSVAVPATTGNATVAIGASASTVGSAGGIAIGNDASAAAGNNIAIGVSASADATEIHGVAIGDGSHSGGAAGKSAGIAIGWQAEAVGGNSCVVGTQSQAPAASTTIFGSNSTGGSWDVVVGQGVDLSSAGGNVFVSGNVAPGSNVQDNICIGTDSGGAFNSGATVGAGIAGSIVLGGLSQAAHANVIILGRNLTSTATGQAWIGSPGTPITTCVIGQGDTQSGGGSAVLLRTTNASGLNVAGSTLTVQSGLATGTAVGGGIVFQVGVTTTSGSTLQATQVALTIHDGTGFVEIAATATPGSANAGTLTNLPTAATAGNPQTYIVLQKGAHTYAIPGWQIT